ncbi:MAG: aminomethyltransferase beta-barrel domain-containing protein, partial [Oceanospirillum sp.]|nr:aminomethyltransferase beta-barrel domain-containing protein [Oceanospirillum sp.]
SEDPWFVAEKDLDNNILIAVQGTDHPLLFSRGLKTESVDWVAHQPPVDGEFKCRAKTRYRQEDQACTVKPLGDNEFEVIFDEPQRAVTPGQSVVFYLDDICLGGAVIERTWRD